MPYFGWEAAAKDTGLLLGIPDHATGMRSRKLALEQSLKELEEGVGMDVVLIPP